MLSAGLTRRIRELLLAPVAGERGLPDITRLAAIAGKLTPRLLGLGVRIAWRHPSPPLGAYAIGVFVSRLPEGQGLFPWYFAGPPWFPDHYIPEVSRRSALILKALAPMLTKDDMGWAMSIADRIPEERWRGLALAYLAPHLEENRLRYVLEVISAFRDPFDLAIALIAVSPAVPDALLKPLQMATLKIGIVNVRRLAVKALDTRWEKFPNRGEELRHLLSDLPEEQRGVFEEYLEDWLFPLEIDPLFAVRNEFAALTQDVDERDLEIALEPMLLEMERIFQDESERRGGRRRRAEPPMSSGGVAAERPIRLDSAEKGPPSGAELYSGDELAFMSPGSDPQAQPAAASEGERIAPARVVNTGFVSALKPSESILGATLACKESYYFWIDVGTPRADSIEKTVTPLPRLPEGTTLRVVVFGFPGQLIVQAGGLAGDMRLIEDGSAIVTRPASRPILVSRNDPILRRQLFFSVNTPAEPGIYSLRCSIYHRSNLLQSRVVTVRVTATSEILDGSLESRIDYAISRRLDPAHLRGLAKQKLSLMLNDNGNGTHGLRFVGSDNFVSEAVVGEGVLSSAIDVTRRALHQASWGKPDPWDQAKPLPYLYETGGSEQQLYADLISLAIRGNKLYFEMCLALTGGRKQFNQLTKIMRMPGSVQIALKLGANHVLPAALFYDHPIDTQKDLVICPAFAAALSGPGPIGNCDCLQGRCPEYGSETVVCPSGFWGYRHHVGLPLTVAEDEDAPTEIAYDPDIAIGMCVAADLQFGPHEKTVRASCQNLEIMVVQDRDEALRIMRDKPFQVVYFYCHGGYTQDGFPTLVMGPGSPIAAENLIKVQWTAPRPLVILNGCHTTALKPETMLNMVNAFVKASGATGVIGTEITIFESLARPFAEACLGSFLAGKPIGEAIRHARLELLQAQLNPLGLVYIPYVSTGVRLVNR